MEKTTYEVIVSDAALSMLDNHAAFLARVNAKAAAKLIDEVLNDMESLSENPQRFPSYENQFLSENRYRKMLSAKRYLILYEIDGESVFVDYIVDCRQNIDWLIR